MLVSFVTFAIFFLSLAPKAHALTTTLDPTNCFLDDVSNATCQSAIDTDGGSTFAVTKGGHLDFQLATLSASAVNSATLYFDNSGTLSGTWGIYVTDTRDGTTLCSSDPATENGSETTDSLGCTITPAQLAAGVWVYIVNNDDKGPEDITLDYIRLDVDYTAAVSISISTDASVAFSTLPANTTQDTTASGINDIETISVDSGPANLDVRSSAFSDGGSSWTYGSSAGSDQVKWEFSNDGSSWTTILVADSLYTHDTNVATSGTSSLYLKITTPTSSSSANQFSTTVTVVASTP